MTDAEVAWAAGLFEGEGCIYVMGRGRGVQRRLVVTSTDRDVVDRFHALVGVGRIYEGSNARLNPRWKPNYEWVCTKWADIIAVLDLLQPWLGERRTAAAEKMRAHPPRPSGWRARYEALAETSA